MVSPHPLPSPQLWKKKYFYWGVISGPFKLCIFNFLPSFTLYTSDVVNSAHNASLAVISTPGKGKKRTCEGQYIGSPAKISREGPSIYSEASQHPNNFSTRLLDTTQGKSNYTSHERSERITSITDNDLMSSAAILVLELVDLSLGHATDDHSYYVVREGSPLVLSFMKSTVWSKYITITVASDFKCSVVHKLNLHLLFSVCAIGVCDICITTNHYPNPKFISFWQFFNKF
jgi:hypothetical protein